MEHLLVLTPLMQPDYLRWVGVGGFLDGRFQKMLSELYHEVCEGDFTLYLDCHCLL